MTYDRPPADDPTHGDATAADAVPGPLRFAAAVAAVEGVVSLGFGIANLVWMEHVPIALTNLVFFALLGVGLLTAARGMLRLRPWSRSVILVGQVFAMVPVWTLRDQLGGVPSLICGLLVASTGLLMVSPSTADLLYAGHREGDDQGRA